MISSLVQASLKITMYWILSLRLKAKGIWKNLKFTETPTYKHYVQYFVVS